MLRSAIISTGIALALVLPFAWKPLHVDDVFFMAWARAMLADPPLGTTVPFNWSGWAVPFAGSSFMNPPVWPGLLALGNFLGFGVASVRLIQVPFLALLLLLVRYLAKHYKVDPAPTALLAGLCPLVWLPATTLMPDLAALTFGSLAILLLHRKKPSMAQCGLALFAAGSMKYSVASFFILVLLAAPLTALWAGLLTLCWPAADLFITRLNHVSLLEFGLRTRQTWQAWLAPNYLLAKGAYSLATLAACTVFPGIFWVLALSRTRRYVRRLLLSAAGAVFAVVIFRLLGGWKAADLPGGPLYAVGSSFNAAWFLISMLGMGLWLAKLLLAPAPRDRAGTRPLLAWLGIVWGVACLAPSHPAARYSIFAAPPLLILIMRDIKQALPARIRRAVTAALLVSTGWLGLNLAYADLQFARCSRDLAREAWRGFGLGNKRVYTTGHWGIQEAVTALGGEVLDVKRARPAAGDVILIPITSHRHYLPKEFDVPRKMLGIVSCRTPKAGIRSIQHELSASFYGGKIWLPYGFVYGSPPEQASPESLLAVEILDPNAP